MTTLSIDGYVHMLSARLRGPRRLTRDVVTEVRDGLSDAAEGYVSAGLSPMAAQRRAVAEFGEVDELAAQFQQTLGVAQGRRTARLLAIAMPLGVVISGLGWRYLHPDSAVGALPEPPSDYLTAVRLVDVFGYGTGVVFGLLWLVMGPVARWVAMPRWLPRVVAGSALLFVAASMLAGIGLTVVSARRSPESIMSWAMLLSAVVWTTVLTAAARATRSVVLAAAHPRRSRGGSALDRPLSG